jgi:hypothetical protein
MQHTRDVIPGLHYRCSSGFEAIAYGDDEKILLKLIDETVLVGRISKGRFIVGSLARVFADDGTCFDQ